MKLKHLYTRAASLATAIAMAAALAPAALAQESDLPSTQPAAVSSEISTSETAADDTPVTSEVVPTEDAPAMLTLVDTLVDYSEGATITISTSEELAAAIANQKNNQKWVLQEGTYTLTEELMKQYESVAIGGETQFVFPITADGLNIIGEGNVTITSDFNPGPVQGGVWHNQNFITISGQNVTLENVTLKANPNDYNNGTSNKVIELVTPGKDLHLKDVTALPLTATDGSDKVNSGSIYFNVTDAGNSTLENVTLSSWISGRTATTGSIKATNVVQDFTNHTHAGAAFAEEGYTFGISGTVVSTENCTIKVDSTVDLVHQVTNTVRENTTIELTDDVAVNEMVYIQTPNVTVKGNGHTITAADDFKVGTHGQNNLFKVQANNVTLDGLNLVATASNKHTLDVWGAQDVVLNNVTLNHENAQSGAPLIVNGSQVDVTGTFETVTGANSWYGINVDSKNGAADIDFTNAEKVTFTGDKLPVVTDNSGSVTAPEKAGLTPNEDGQYLPDVITVKTEAELKAAANMEGANIALANDIKLTSYLYITKDNVTIDGCGYTIYAEGDFSKGTSSSEECLITAAESNNLTLKDMTLRTGSNNRHALNLWKCENVVLDGVIIDHQTKGASAGVALNIVSSSVETKNGFKVTTGTSDYNGITVDNKYGDASLSFGKGDIEFIDNRSEFMTKLIPFVKFDKGSTSPDDTITIEHPENAGLVADGSGFDICLHDGATELVGKVDATTEHVGYTGDTCCAKCHKVLTYGTVIPKLKEDNSSAPAATPAPTATPAPADNKAVYYTCPACGYHDWVAGENGYVCSHCNYVESVKQLSGYNNVKGVYTPVSTSAQNAANNTQVQSAIPQTGDEMNIALLFVLLAASATGLGVTTVLARRNKK